MDRGVSRRNLLAGGAAALLVAGCGGEEDPGRPRDSGDATAPGDLSILEFALTLEYFEAAYYGRLVEERLLSGRDQEMIKRIAENEAAHVDLLEAAIEPLGGKAPERPKPNFAVLLDGGPEAILRKAADVESIGPAAYLGQASSIQDEGLLAAALSIHTIEARQAAALNFRVGRSFVPDGALGVPLTRDEVLARASEFML